MIDNIEEIEIINKLIDRLTSIRVLGLSKISVKEIQDVCHILLRYKVLLQQTYILEKRGIE